MYRYVECEKVNGKTCRMGGITTRSLRAMKHLPKVGKVQYVRGYIYRGRLGTQHVGVLVKGELGTIRFGGFAWGYGGEGPRGLERLFDALNVPEWCRNVVRWVKWPSFRPESIGEYWRVTFEGEQCLIAFRVDVIKRRAG